MDVCDVQAGGQKNVVWRSTKWTVGSQFKIFWKNLRQNQCWGKSKTVIATFSLNGQIQTPPPHALTKCHPSGIRYVSRSIIKENSGLLNWATRLKSMKRGVFHVRTRCDRGTRWCICLRRRAITRKVAGSIPNGVVGTYNSFRPRYGPEFVSTSKRNWVPGILPGVKGAGV
jgi:hypothetical protein